MDNLEIFSNWREAQREKLEALRYSVKMVDCEPTENTAKRIDISGVNLEAMITVWSSGDVEIEAGHVYPDEIISIPRALADLTLIERLDYYLSQLLEKAIPTAIKESWKNEEFGPATRILYEATFSIAEMARLKQGLIPQGMEDKWFAFYEEGILYFLRSWTGQPVYKVAFEEVSAGVVRAKGYCSDEMLKITEADYNVKLLDFLIDVLLLGKEKDFPIPENIPDSKSSVYQHAVSGTGYSTTTIKQKTPWWKFWA